jgi:hypothetical protein
MFRVSVLILSFLVATNGLHVAHSIMFMRRTRRRHTETKRNTYSIVKKCNYINEMFPMTNNTCSLPPSMEYQNIYDSSSYKMDLWKFQQTECLHYTKDPITLVYLVVLIVWLWFFLFYTCP